jgi:hypothetical protein
MQRTLCLAVTMLAMAAGTAAADQGRASGSPIGGEHKGVIAGRVTDASAQSVPGVFVTLMRRTTSRGVTRVHPVAVRFGATTNAKGEYSLERLASGPYYVVALPRDIPRNVRIASDSQAYRFGHGVTYHPAASRSSDAKVVNVGAGAAAIADITLAPAHLAEVSGTAIGSDGKPAKRGRLLVAHGDGLFGVDSIAVPIRPDGTFLIKGLPPGTYYLHFREGKWPPPRDVIPRVSGATVKVYDGDVRRVRVMPIEMVKITGRLVGDARRSLKPSEITVAGTPADSNGNPGPSRGGIVKEDFTFEARAWPAVGYIRIFVGRQEWAVKTLRLNGVDLGGNTIEFRAGEDISGLEVELDKPMVR